MKSIYIINFHCLLNIERDNPLKSFDTLFEGVEMTLEGCLYLNNWSATRS
jgi:hypothetical protein